MKRYFLAVQTRVHGVKTGRWHLEVVDVNGCTLETWRGDYSCLAQAEQAGRRAGLTNWYAR